MLLNNNQPIQSNPAAAMVIGGGIGGMRAALDLANTGLKVYLIEQTPCLGGRVAQLGYMFPQHDCVLCRGTADHGYGCTRPSISPAYIHHNQHPNIEILTNTRVVDREGQAGDFTVLLRQDPRYVNPTRCINCGYCSEVCPVELLDDYQRGMTTRKAVFKVAPRAAPDAYVVDRGPYCDECLKCEEICPTDAIDLNQQPKLRTVNVGAIVLALGMQPYDPGDLEELGYGRYPNVLHAMDFERLASRSGPTEGIVFRPSDRKRPQSIAWLQCIGSRDQRYGYCSSICCMYATKEAMLAKQRLGEDIECRIFFIDERAFNKQYSTYFAKARTNYGIQYTRCRVSQLYEDSATQDLILQYADPNGKVHEDRFDMVVLAVGIRPPESAQHMANVFNIELNEYGFCQTDKFAPLQTTHSGVFVCGGFSSPKEIVETIIDASGAAGEVMRLMNDRLNTHTFSQEFPFLYKDEFPPERDVSAEKPRVGFFACSCGDTISKNIDLQMLAQRTTSFPGVIFSEIVKTACFPETVAYLQDQIEENKLNRVVVAGCSNRTHDSLFQRVVRQVGLNPYLVELVNLREQCSTVHQDQPQFVNRKAQELVRVAVGRVSKAQQIHKRKHRCRASALVIGGGLAGMTASLYIADSGYEVHLVERSSILGGSIQTLYYVPEGFNPQRLCRDLINRVRSHQRIHVYTNTEVVGHSGHIGDFLSRLESKSKEGIVENITIEHGVTVMATGGVESRDHPWLNLPGVITQRDLEDQIVHHPEDFAALKNVVMIQCVRPEGVPDYCSRVCCTTAMKNAVRIKLYNPNCRVTVLYKNIVTYGFREEYYTEARRHGVVFIRYTDENPPKIELENGQLRVRVRDLSMDRWISLSADLIPLSISVVPSEGTQGLAKMFRVPITSGGFFEEAQLKLRPMDFMRDGIFLAGMAHYPKFVEETISHALAAAARALTVLSQREFFYLGGVVAQVDPEKCVGCLTCTRVCPFGIPRIVCQEGRYGVGGLGGAAYIDESLCQGCGTCTGECPANAIQLVNYTDEQMILSEIGGLGSWLPVNVHTEG